MQDMFGTTHLLLVSIWSTPVSQHKLRWLWITSNLRALLLVLLIDVIIYAFLCHYFEWLTPSEHSCLLLQIFYLVGFGLFCVESLISIWVIQVQNLLIFVISYFWCLALFENCVIHVKCCAASLHVLQRKWKSRRNEEGGSKINYDGSTVTWQWWWNRYVRIVEFVGYSFRTTYTLQYIRV